MPKPLPPGSAMDLGTQMWSPVAAPWTPPWSQVASPAPHIRSCSSLPLSLQFCLSSLCPYLSVSHSLPFLCHLLAPLRCVWGSLGALGNLGNDLVPHLRHALHHTFGHLWLAPCLGPLAPDQWFCQARCPHHSGNVRLLIIRTFLHLNSEYNVDFRLSATS